MFYLPQADELRAFFRDKLGLPFEDVGEGWLIFKPLAGEIGCHPGPDVRHDISLCCDDIQKTVDELRGRGVEFTQDIEDWGWGVGTFVKAPGDLVLQIYQPRY